LLVRRTSRETGGGDVGDEQPLREVGLLKGIFVKVDRNSEQKGRRDDKLIGSSETFDKVFGTHKCLL